MDDPSGKVTHAYVPPVNKPSDSPPQTYSLDLSGPRLIFARLAWMIVVLLVIVVFLVALPYRYAQLQIVSPQAETRVGELLPQEAVWLEQMGLSPRFQALYFTTLEFISALPFFLVAGLIFLRKSEDWMGLLISMVGILNGVFLTPLANGLLTELPILELPLLIFRNLSIFGLVLLFYIFPDGRLIPPWSRWVMIIWGIYMGMTLFLPALRPPLGIASFRDVDIPILAFFVTFLALSASAQVYRYRYFASPLQRQQTKWVVFGLVTQIVMIVGTILPAIFIPALRQPGIPALQMRFFAVTITLLFTIPILPVTMTIAILHYRLWDIDLLIRRTLVYGVLTASLVLLYFGLVVVLEGILRSLVGSSGQVATVISTLVIAALFNPLRRRIQNFIDRRFYRRKYDAEKTLAEFADAARSETDLEQLSARLTYTVQETLQPAQLSLWLQVDRKKTDGEGR